MTGICNFCMIATSLSRRSKQDWGLLLHPLHYVLKGKAWLGVPLMSSNNYPFFWGLHFVSSQLFEAQIPHVSGVGAQLCLSRPRAPAHSRGRRAPGAQNQWASFVDSPCRMKFALLTPLTWVSWTREGDMIVDHIWTFYLLDVWRRGSHHSLVWWHGVLRNTKCLIWNTVSQHPQHPRALSQEIHKKYIGCSADFHTSTIEDN